MGRYRQTGEEIAELDIRSSNEMRELPLNWMVELSTPGVPRNTDDRPIEPNFR